MRHHKAAARGRAESSHPVLKTRHARSRRTVRAAEQRDAVLNAVPDHPDTASRAARGQLLDRALERIEGMGHSSHHDLEGSIVFISARFTLVRHEEGHNEKVLPRT